MGSEKNLSFSSEVAETLGVECAIILNQYNENLLEDITSLDSLIKSTKKNISFLDEEKIKDSLNTLIKYQLIDINKKTYKLKTPNKTSDSDIPEAAFTLSIEFKVSCSKLGKSFSSASRGVKFTTTLSANTST